MLLLVEDEFLIALDLMERLRKLGFMVLGPARTVQEALDRIAEHSLDAVVLDLNLKGELSIPVAEELTRRGVPYLVLTAYAPTPSEAPVIANARRLSKPVDDSILGRTLREMLAAA